MVDVECGRTFGMQLLLLISGASILHVGRTGYGVLFISCIFFMCFVKIVRCYFILSLS